MLAAAGGKVVIADLNEAAGTALARNWRAVRQMRRGVRSRRPGRGGRRAEAGPAVRAGQLRGHRRGAKTVGKNGPHPLDAFEKTIRVNLIGTFNMIRLAAAAMVQNTPDAEGERGVIINTASVAAFDGQIGQAAYAASKGGVVGMTLAIARDPRRRALHDHRAGLFETPMLLGMPQEVQDARQDGAVPAAPGPPGRICKLVQAIIGNTMLNGEVIRLDGAIRMQPK
jgi:NAD(P)-dependent dehydrogenase (short-subunit alcohol dehydrogenase family)